MVRESRQTPVSLHGVLYPSLGTARIAKFLDYFWNVEWHVQSGTFHVSGPRPLMVVPDQPQSEWRTTARAALELFPDWHADVLVLGNHYQAPEPEPVEWPDDAVHAGALGQHFGCGDDAHWDDEACSHADCAVGWVECGCGGLAVHHTYQSFTSRPCGCYDGGNNIRGPFDPNTLDDAWGWACDTVREDGVPVIGR